LTGVGIWRFLGEVVEDAVVIDVSEAAVLNSDLEGLGSDNDIEREGAGEGEGVNVWMSRFFGSNSF